MVIERGWIFLTVAFAGEARVDLPPVDDPFRAALRRAGCGSAQNPRTALAVDELCEFGDERGVSD